MIKLNLKLMLLMCVVNIIDATNNTNTKSNKVSTLHKKSKNIKKITPKKDHPLSAKIIKECQEINSTLLNNNNIINIININEIISEIKKKLNEILRIIKTAEIDARKKAEEAKNKADAIAAEEAKNKAAIALKIQTEMESKRNEEKIKKLLQIRKQRNESLKTHQIRNLLFSFTVIFVILILTNVILKYHLLSIQLTLIFTLILIPILWSILKLIRLIKLHKDTVKILIISLMTGIFGFFAMLHFNKLSDEDMKHLQKLNIINK